MNTKKGLILTALLLAVVMAFAACSAASAPAASGSAQQSAQKGEAAAQASTAAQYRPFGQFSAVDSNGNTVTQDIFSGHKLTMVNIWATYCGPCLSEMPELGEISREYADKGVQVVGIPTDVTDAQGNAVAKRIDLLKQIVEKTGADYTHIIPSEGLIKSKLALVKAVPETIFVDSQGNQVGSAYSGARDKSKWMEIIDQTLAALPKEAVSAASSAAAESTAPAASSASASAGAALVSAEYAPDLYTFETKGLDGQTYTDKILNEGTVMTVAVVWDPAWEGSKEALQRLQSYLEKDDKVNAIGFVMNAEGKEKEAQAVVNAAGVKFPQLMPTGGLEKYVTGATPMFVAIAPWGTVTGSPLAYSATDAEWREWLNYNVVDVTSGCCG